MQRDLLEIRTADNVGIGYEAAGIGSRTLAGLLDLLVVAFGVLVAEVLVVNLIADSASALLISLVIASLAIFVEVLYFLILELAMAGRTIGKRALGLRVIAVDGGMAGFSELLVRNVLRLVDLPFGLICMFFNPQSRRFGDLLGGTVVIRERGAQAVAPLAAVMLRTPDAGPAIDGLDALGTHEYTAVRAFLTRQQMTLEQRSRLAAEMARRLHDRLGLSAQAPERQWPPELFLERLYLQMASRLEGRR